MKGAADQFSVPVCNQWSRRQQVTAVYESRIRFRAKLCSERFLLFYYYLFSVKQKVPFEALGQTISFCSARIAK